MTLGSDAATPASHAGGVGRTVLRRIRKGMVVAIALIVFLLLAGAGYEALAGGVDAYPFPPPGQMVDVGGYRMHIQCVGDGSPTVVLDAGLSGSSLDWSLVQPDIGTMTRVCAVDRAGEGWSEPGPAPRSPHQIAGELHRLLTAAGVAGPYVLVGHSLAGKNVRLFALDHPDEVAGIVLVDGRSEYVDDHTSAADAEKFKRAIRGEGVLYGTARRFGIARLFGSRLMGAPGMPAATRAAIAILNSRKAAIDATTAEADQRATDDALLAAAPSLGSMPLVVLVAGQNAVSDPLWLDAQQRQAALSSNSRLKVVDGSGHYIHWEHPAVVIDAVRGVVEEVRSRP